MAVALPEVEADTAAIPGGRWNVVLFNDDDHTYDYVVEMLVRLFAMPPDRAFRHACEVDAAGSSIVDTTSRERAELKVEQIHAFGADPRLPRSRTSMAAVAEPA